MRSGWTIFLEKVTGIKAKVTKCGWSKNVIVAMIENSGIKKDIMKRKGKLGDRKIYIENDLTWEERKRQERIYAWVKGEKEKERFIKIGYARVNVKGRWVSWREVEKKLEEKEARKNEEGERARDRIENIEGNTEDEGSNKKDKKEEN